MNMRVVVAAVAGLFSVTIFTSLAAILQNGTILPSPVASPDTASSIAPETLLVANSDGNLGEVDFFPLDDKSNARPKRPQLEQVAQAGDDPFAEEGDLEKDPFAPDEPGVIDGLAPGGDVLDADELSEELRLYKALIGNSLRDGRAAIRQINRQKRVKRCNAPNVVLIDIDDLGYGDLGSYGQKSIETTEIDQLAYQGVRFTNYYAGTSLGIPSRCSLVTGKHTGHCFLRENKPGAIPSEEATIGEMMYQAGYATSMIGHWNLGAPDSSGAPYRQGFEDTYSYLTGDDPKDYYPDFLWDENQKDMLDGERLQRFAFERFLRQTESFVKENRRRPFFVYLTLPLLHGNLPEAPTTQPYTEEDWPEREKQYAAMLTLMDEGVGRIRKMLQEQGLINNSVILLTSVNGPRNDISPPQTFNSTRGLRGARGSLYEGGIRVPLIAWGPGVIKRPHASGVVCAAWDIVPTLADLVHATWRPKNMDGMSIAKVLTANEYIPIAEMPEHDYLYWEVHKEDTLAQAMRMRKWKAVRNSLSGELEIFDLEEDPAEEHNVADQHPEIARQFNALLTATRTPMPGERFAQ